MDPIEDVNPDEEKKFPVKVGQNVYNNVPTNPKKGNNRPAELKQAKVRDTAEWVCFIGAKENGVFNFFLVCQAGDTT